MPAMEPLDVSESFLVPQDRPPLDPAVVERFRARTTSCTACALRPGCIAPVPTAFASRTSPRPTVLIVGEAPGEQEDRARVPFRSSGPVGAELDRLILDRLGLSRNQVHISHVVRCRPPGNRPPLEPEIDSCIGHLIDEIALVRPKVILALGATAAAALAEDYADMEFSWGTVGPLKGALARAVGYSGALVVVCPHPAFALRSPRMFNRIVAAFGAVRAIIDGAYRPVPFSPVRTFRATPDMIPDWFERIAMDTETDHLGRPECFSWSFDGDEAFVEWTDPETFEPGPCARLLATMVPFAEVVLHNAPFDVPVLAKLGIHVAKFRDSMTAAFLLGDEPGGLKSLAFRHGGMRMDSYLSVVGEGVRRAHWEEILEQILGIETEMSFLEPDGRGNPVADAALRAMDCSPYEGFAIAMGATDRQSRTWGRALAFRALTGRLPSNAAKALHKALAAFKESDPDLYETLSSWTPAPLADKDLTKGALGRLVPVPGNSLRLCDLAVAERYSGQDAAATMRVWRVLEGKLRAAGLERSEAIEMAATPMVLAYGETGVFVDPVRLESLRGEYTAEAASVVEAMRGYADSMGFGAAKVEAEPDDEPDDPKAPLVFNPAATAHVRTLLYDLEGHRAPAYTETGLATTEKATLERLADLEGSVAATLLLRWRMYQNFVGMHLDPLARALARSTDGRVHPTYSLARAETGRLAASDPNILNVPVRSEEGARIRELFRAEPGNLLVGADYAQIELRVLAGLSGDRGMVEAIARGEDLHAKTACIVFRIDPATFDPKNNPRHKMLRSIAKIVNFGIPYGVGPSGLRDQLHAQGMTDYDESMCAKIIEDWFRAYPGVRAWFDERLAEAVRTGYVRCWSGRRRPMAQARASAFRIASEAARECRNTPIQGGAGEIVKLAMAALWERMAEVNAEGWGVRALFQLHDALYFEVPADCAEAWAEIVGETMRDAVRHPTLGMFDFPVPLEVDVHVGSSWADL